MKFGCKGNCCSFIYPRCTIGMTRNLAHLPLTPSGITGALCCRNDSHAGTVASKLLVGHLRIVLLRLYELVHITGKKLSYVKYSTKGGDLLRFYLYLCHAIDDFACIVLQH